MLRALALAALAAGAAAAPVITANVTETTNLGYVGVQWSGVASKDRADAFLGVYCPANASTARIDPLPYPATAPWTAAAAVKYVQLSDIPGAVATGAGNWTFRLVNLLSGDCAIVLFAGGIAAPAELARTAPISFTDSDGPMRGRLARTQDPSEMRVTWNSLHNDEQDGAGVRWGFTAGGPYPHSAPAEATTYAQRDLCGVPAATQGWIDPRYWLTAVMASLPPSTVVFYTYGSDVHGWSAEASFISAPPLGPEVPVNIISVADMGMTEFDGSLNHWDEPDAGKTTDHMRNVSWSGSGYDYSLLLHSGDLSYATGTLAKWGIFDSRLEGLSDHLPYMIGQGNHERDWPGTGTNYDTSTDSGGECGVPTQTRFPMPVPTPHMQDEGFWALTHGSVAVVMINTELQLGPGSQQYDFVQRSLAAVNRSQTPWVIVTGHRPMYYVDGEGSHIDANFAQLEPLLVQYKVDLFIVGHVHNAFVSCPVIAGACQTPASPGAWAGPVHVCVGNAGQGLTPIPSTTAPWVDWQISEWGYSVIKVASSKLLTMSLYGDDTNDLLYTFSLQRA